MILQHSADDEEWNDKFSPIKRILKYSSKFHVRGTGVPFPGESVDKFAGHRGRGRGEGGPTCFALRLASHDRPPLLSASPRESFVPSTSGGLV